MIRGNNKYNKTVKEYKNLGESKACPKCKCLAVNAANFSSLIPDIDYFYIKCPHCYKKGINTLLKVELTSKVDIKVTVVEKVQKKNTVPKTMIVCFLLIFASVGFIMVRISAMDVSIKKIDTSLQAVQDTVKDIPSWDIFLDENYE